ncbi:hypothetical protein Celaphus_00005220 [Cervus elaphus hippelaphus]|uniref:Uncharacterized protein n=1 Tax=Cervus elaphus hippelaphus TaxID=46360 RepID=A0A212CVV5_CEREH|nr:hypothetical protein Celaphus_00005220 [Cervus elaphus hippelaphus]
MRTSDPVSQALSASPPSPVLQSQHLRLAAMTMGTTIMVVTAYKLTCVQSSPPAEPQDQGSTCVTSINQRVDTLR